MMNKVRETLKKAGIEPGDTILVACSGGPDSVALLIALYRLGLNSSPGLKLSVAHYDHGLRGEESRRDARFVRDLAHTFEVPFYQGRGNVKAHAHTQGITIQEAARDLRYAFLRAVRKKAGTKWIATAHTMDDQAEEVVLRLIRGAGLSGLAGIPLKTNDMIIRPLLHIEKKEIMAFLKDSGQSFCEDSSNIDPKYMRNRIRHQLIPLLKEINPSFLKAIKRTTQVLSDDRAYLHEKAEEAMNSAIVYSGHGVGARHAVPLHLELSVQKLSEYHPSILRQAIKSAINHIEPGILRCLRSDHINAVLNLIRLGKTSKEVVLPKGIIVRRSYNRLSFTRKDGEGRHREDVGASHEITCLAKGVSPPCKLNLSSPMGILTMTYNKSMSPERLRQKKIPKKLYIDADLLKYPLTVRPRMAGERFWPLGAPRPYKLKELLIARKIPRHLRRYIPLVISDDQVVAVAGIEVSEPFKITGKTKKMVEILWEPSKELARELSLVNTKSIGTEMES